MKWFFRILLPLLTFTLAGCGPIYQTKYSYEPPRSSTGRMCAAQCLQNKSTCQQMCQMRTDTCQAQMRQNSFYQYEIYRAQQTARSLPVEKSPADFEDRWGCMQQCHCDDEFNLCYQTCGGTVKPYQVCTAFCNRH